MTDNIDLAIAVLRVIEKSMSKPKARKSFPKTTQKTSLSEQKNRCNDCGKKSKVWDFDHIDGNNSLAVIIPKTIKEIVGIKQGTRFLITTEKGRITLTPQ